MNTFQVTIYFEMNEDFTSKIPEHRAFINSLIENGIIEYYSVSLESFRLWIMMRAKDKKEVRIILSKSPIYTYWTLEIDRLFVFDGKTYRLPKFELN